MIQIPAPVRRPADSAPAEKAGPVGPGAGPLMTEYLLPRVLGQDANQKMARALKVGMEVDWVRAAERIISGKVAACEWKLEDPDGEAIGGSDPQWEENWKTAKAFDPLALGALGLLQNPQADIPIADVGRRQTRRQQLEITSRHMGLAGNGVWYLDRYDGLGCPHAILYIRPDRLTPETTQRGILTGWRLDKRTVGNDEGTKLEIDRVRLFQLQQPDVGIFAPGLIESSMAKAINNGLVDTHFSSLLGSGGRISGVIAPKEGRIDDDNIYNQLVRDWRNITEQPDAARRLQIVRAPIDFTPTVQSVSEMAIIDLMYHNRDSLLALWGVALSLLGGTTSSGGLNSGESRKYDEAALWQGAVNDRLVEIEEGVQSIMDLWQEHLGWAPQFSFVRPEFDDDLPNYTKVKDSAGLAMRNKERRSLVGLDPFGDPRLDNAIWMPVNVVAAGMAPDEETGQIPEMIGIQEVSHPAQVAEEPNTGSVDKTPASDPNARTAAGGGANAQAATRVAGGGGAAKASLASPVDLRTRAIRERVEETVLPRVTDAVHTVLSAQQRRTARLIEKNWSRIQQMPDDDSLWWPNAQQDEKLLQALGPMLETMADQVATHIEDALGADDSTEAGP